MKDQYDNFVKEVSKLNPYEFIKQLDTLQMLCEEFLNIFTERMTDPSLSLAEKQDLEIDGKFFSMKMEEIMEDCRSKMGTDLYTHLIDPDFDCPQ